MSNFRKWLLNPVTGIGIILGVMAFGISVWGYNRVHGQLDLMKVLTDFYANISAELGSIAITVIVIDRLNRRREGIQQRKWQQGQSMMQLLTARTQEQKQAALDGMKEFDLMQGANFRGANLQRTDLGFANLEGADLRRANLEGANLRRANLEGATFNETTMLPNETYWTPDTDMGKYTDPDHVDADGNPDFWQPAWAKEQQAADGTS